jgi:hypothetical protein
MVIRASIQVEDTYELIFHPMCNLCMFLPHIIHIYSVLPYMYMYIVYFILYFIFYTNFANEFIIGFEITF